MNPKAYRILPIAGLLATALLLNPRRSGAQEAAAPETKDEIIRLEQFEVTTTLGTYAEAQDAAAMKSPGDLKDLPKTVQVLNASFIKDLRALTLDDLYPYVIGMNREAAVGVGFTLRGFSDSTDDTLQNLQVDGLPGTASRFGSPTTANVERVEILKGPTSVLYGLMQPGGLVNIVTKVPSQTASNSVFTSIGTYAGQAGKFGTGADLGNSVNFTAVVDSTGPIDKAKHWLYRFIVDYEDLHGFQKYAWAQNYSFFPSLTYRVDENTEITAQVEDTRQSRFSNSFLAIPFNTASLAPNFGTTYQDPNSKEYDNGETYYLNFTHRFDDNWVLNVKGRHVEHEDGKHAFENQNVTSVDSLGTVPPVVPTLADVQNSIVVRRLRHQLNHRQYTFIDANVHGEVGPENFKNTLLVGVNGGYEMENFLRLAFLRSAPFNVNLYDPVFTVAPFPADPVPPTSDGITRQYNYGAYASDQIRIASHWRVILSERHDRQDGNYHDRYTNPPQDYSRTDQAWIPSAGLMYEPTDNVGIYASYSRSFVPPNATTVDANGVQDFPPTTAHQIETGIKASFLQKTVTTDLALYDIVRNNVAEPIPNGVSPIDGSQTYELSGQQESKGIELSVTYQPVPNWQVQAGYTYDNVWVSRSIDPTMLGGRSENAPRSQFNFWNRYNVPTGPLRGFGVGAGVIYVGDRHGVTSNLSTVYIEIPSYLRLDGALYYQWKRYSFALNIANALDRAYFVYIASNNNVHAGDPRKLTLSLSVPF